MLNTVKWIIRKSKGASKIFYNLSEKTVHPHFLKPNSNIWKIYIAKCQMSEADNECYRQAEEEPSLWPWEKYS